MNECNCPVCGKQLIPSKAEIPEEYEEYLMGTQEDEEELLPRVSEECPVQRCWTMAVPFQVGEFGFLVVHKSDQVFAPLTMVCDYHPLVSAIPDSIRNLASWIDKVPQEDFIVSDEAADWLKEQSAKVQGDHPEEVKVFWMWYQVMSEKEDGEEEE